MLCKFENQSNRVKGLSFHPSRQWILASLHNGAVQLWDYRMQTLLDKFEEHEGPVRGVCFHPTQPLFASGGDDYKVKIWNFKQRKCLFTLEGHLDYIRTVDFHRELPWLMSASDDQTIRVWNWQSRNCLAILTGHNHYIMCALFHPTEDLIVSGSLDQTVRVWDFKNLRQKFYAAGGKGSDILLGTDVVVKFVLEGHDRGVNWVCFHNSAPYIVSASDDRTVRLWRYTDTKAWEVETLRGHNNNVSCVIFHPNLEAIISNSEDKSMRIWDMNRRNTIHTYRRENDRFWTLAAHPTSNILAAGYDSGFVIFKLEKERIPATAFKKNVYLVANRMLKKFDQNGRESLLASVRPPVRKEVYADNPAYIQVNPFSTSELHILLQYQQEQGNYLMYSFGKEVSSDRTASNISGSAMHSCFVSKDKFAILNKSREITVLDFRNTSKKKLSPPCFPTAIFLAGINRILIYDDEVLYLYDITSREVQASIEVSGLKRVSWSPNMEYIALMCKHTVMLCRKNLELACTGPKERMMVKSGVWDSMGVFLYCTSLHIRYLIMNGDVGTVKSLENTLYLASIDSNFIYAVDRNGELQKLSYTNIEYKFKLALHNKRYNEVKLILESGGLKGHAVVKYLQDKGFPEVALYFVEDDKTRFDLAIQAGTIEVALQSAYRLNLPECWQKLGIEALRQGNAQIVEMAYQKTRNLDRLSMLYLITGNLTKLGKMQQIAQTRGDKLRLFHNAILRGDIEKRIEMLAESGQVPLAYVTAKIHNVQHMLNGPLEESLGSEGVKKFDDYISKLGKTTAMHPMIPIFNQKNGGDQNWPLHQVITSEFELKKNQSDPGNPYAMTNETVAVQEHDFTDVGVVEEGGWGEDIDFELEEESPGWGQEDFEVPEVQQEVKTDFKATTAGVSLQQKWSRTCVVPGELVAAGAFQAAMQALTRTAGVTNFLPLKELFMTVHMGGQVSLPLLPHLKPLELYTTRLKTSGTSRPHVSITLSQLTSCLKSAYKLTTKGQFAEALVEFRKVLHSILFASVTTEKEETEVKELVKICVEYVTCMRLELARQEQVKSNPARALELCYYMSLCKLQPPHQSLTLRSAISLAYKNKNFITCTSLCKRFIELTQNYPQVVPGDSKQVLDKHKKLLAYCQQVFTNDLGLGVELPETSPDIVSMLCQRSFSQVSPAVPTSRCPFCGSLFHKEYKGSICDTCQISQIGLEALGLKVFN